MKFAYLIIAHNNFDQLQILINLLDDPDNDIYVHIDKKCKTIPLLKTKTSHLYIIKPRIDVRWGDYSQIQCEMELFKSSFYHAYYDYFHLLSGVDLPIKSQNFIQKFFNDNKGKEFVGFYHKDDKWKEKVCKYHFFTRWYRYNGYYASVINKLRNLSEKVFNGIFNRDKDSFYFRKGSNWCSISRNFCSYLISKENLIKKRFKYTLCADEIFVQTVLWNSPFKKAIYYPSNERLGCLREIDWIKGDPYTWGGADEDEEILLSSPCLFARKFDYKNYSWIVKALYNALMHNVNLQS